MFEKKEERRFCVNCVAPAAIKYAPTEKNKTKNNNKNRLTKYL